ncbi:Tyrosine-protein kinase [Trema orientale]|uniref:Tyrosine-protein kinase n=1 Tax=Trema orientale TaxID=63057 RepID=A0A2P5ESJ7_TREOI|nr:Tyrosine-protein kinase [Trema orientale]
MNYCVIGSAWIGFDDVEAVEAKIAYAKEKKLLGYNVFQVINDDNWLLSRAAYRNTSSTDAENLGSDSPNLQVFSFSKIREATNKFSDENKLGEGGFGLVYKITDKAEQEFGSSCFVVGSWLGNGKLLRGKDIVVKRLSKTSTQGVKEFENEVTLTARL